MSEKTDLEYHITRLIDRMERKVADHRSEMAKAAKSLTYHETALGVAQSALTDMKDAVKQAKQDAEARVAKAKPDA